MPTGLAVDAIEGEARDLGKGIAIHHTASRCPIQFEVAHSLRQTRCQVF